MNGYKEASIVEKTISKLVEEQPLDKPENAREWLIYIRVISKYLSFLEEKAMNTLDEHTESICKKKAAESCFVLKQISEK
jgi:hypothetical protein